MKTPTDDDEGGGGFTWPGVVALLIFAATFVACCALADQAWTASLIR